MEPNTVFNLTVCILGISVFLIHSVDILLKKEKRRDEIALLGFFLFTALHFSAYLLFTFLQVSYKSNALTMGFYTAFYVMNNLEVLFFFLYAIHYIAPKKKVKDVLTIVHHALLGLFILLDFLNLITHFFFSAQNGTYLRSPHMIISQGYQVTGLAMVFVLAITSKNLSKTEKTAFVLYCLLPFLAIIAQNLLPGFAIGYCSLIISIEILFLFASQRKNVALAERASKNKEAEIALMASQIKPHFIFNSLSAVSALIEIDPGKAQKALDDFSEYLRRNLSALSDMHPVLLEDELCHVKLYLSIEKIRFEERLNVTFDLQSMDFLLPSLSLQPIVENAVKHGILKKEEGGNILIRSYENEESHFLEVIDDGVGFNPESIEGQGHIGLSNVSYRIQSLCHGKLLIESKPGEGSKVTMVFPKGGK